MKTTTIRIRPAADPFTGIPNADDKLYTTTRPLTSGDIYAAGMKIGALLRGRL